MGAVPRGAQSGAEWYHPYGTGWFRGGSTVQACTLVVCTMHTCKIITLLEPLWNHSGTTYGTTLSYTLTGDGTMEPLAGYLYDARADYGTRGHRSASTALSGA